MLPARARAAALVPEERMTEARRTHSIALRSLLFTFVVPGTVGGYLPWAIARGSGAAVADSPVWSAVGVVALGVGLAIYAWCVTDFVLAGRGTPLPLDPPRELVVRGLYRFARNPMYVGVLTVIAGQALLFRSIHVGLYAIVVFALFQLFILGYEEPALRRDFDGAYERYCEQVPRWLPRL
jgi:protein-S-isoprenylcysteine O-methyltransferase Ste14